MAIVGVWWRFGGIPVAIVAILGRIGSNPVANVAILWQMWRFGVSQIGVPDWRPELGPHFGVPNWGSQIRVPN